MTFSVASTGDIFKRAGCGKSARPVRGGGRRPWIFRGPFSTLPKRFNVAAYELAQLLNETETVFPGTDLTMIFKITANPDC